MASLVLAATLSQNAPVEVHPKDLEKRRDLIGKEIIIDDRIRLFFPKISTQWYHEILLKRTPVVVRLPEAFQYRSAPSAQSVRVQGVLRQEGSALICEATAKPVLYATDLKRLQNEIATVAPGDIKTRLAWADWAARRGQAFDDDTLVKEAIKISSEAIARELERAENRTPEAILNLARKAQERSVPKPEPAALMHLAYRMKMAEAKTPADYDAIAREVSAALPFATSVSKFDLKGKTAVYDADPLSGYRQASIEMQAALDRRLWADCVAESIRLRAQAQPDRLAELAAEARKRLPDRPELAANLRRRDLEAALADVPSMRRTEMLELERTYREDLNQPARAREILLSWLEARKAALRPTSADAHTELAKEYLLLLKDKTTAASLLTRAVEIDPDNREASDQFQRMGYVRTDGSWHDPLVAVQKSEIPGHDVSPELSEDGFLGLTPAEIKAQLGEPKRVSRVATQGRVSIQWTYETARGSQYIDFLQKLGEAQPTVIGRFVTK